MLLPYIQKMAESLCDHKVYVKLEPGEQTDHYIIHVLPEDMGNILGKKGRNIDAIRHVAFCITMTQKFRKCAISIAQ